MRWKRPGGEPSASPPGASRSAVGAEEDVDGTHLESLFCLRTQFVASRVEVVFSAFLFPGGEPTTTLFCARRRGGVALRAAPPKHARVASTRPARPARSDTSSRPRGPRRGEPVELGSTSAIVEIDNANASFDTRAERFRDSSS